MPSTKANGYKYTKACIQRRRDWIYEIKNVPCLKCGGVFPPYVMQFHHRDPSVKSFGIGVASYRRGRKDVETEIAKCDIVCANCHFILEHEKRLDSSVGRAVLS